MRSAGHSTWAAAPRSRRRSVQCCAIAPYGGIPLSVYPAIVGETSTTISNRRKDAGMTNHDHSYKLLFSHPEMVADLIRGFVREDWVEQVDFDTLEKVSGSFVTDNLLGREDDLIWRVRWRGQWLYVYLLLEFQSTVDRLDR